MAVDSWQKSYASGTPLSKEDLRRCFEQLDRELADLKIAGALEEDIWCTIEMRVHVPASLIAEADRRWWWEQLYGLLERNGLTELTYASGAQK